LTGLREMELKFSVVKQGLSSGAAHKYNTTAQARAVLVTFGFAPELIDRQLRNLSKVPPSFLLRFPETEIADEVLRSLEFTAAVFQAP
jgi:hypothetical protein